jgi:hypothetical protein
VPKVLRSVRPKLRSFHWPSSARPVASGIAAPARPRLHLLGQEQAAGAVRAAHRASRRRASRSCPPPRWTLSDPARPHADPGNSHADPNPGRLHGRHQQAPIHGRAATDAQISASACIPGQGDITDAGTQDHAAQRGRHRRVGHAAASASGSARSSSEQATRARARSARPIRAGAGAGQDDHPPQQPLPPGSNGETRDRLTDFIGWIPASTTHGTNPPPARPCKYRRGGHADHTA